MSSKYALYLPFHIIAALENEGFSDAEIGAFVRGVIKYHLEGTEPRFDDRSLNLLFSSCKQEFDHNIERYEAKVESCRKNGKKGGAPPGNKNAVGNRGGAAPPGNRNAAKSELNPNNPPVEFEPEKQTQPKQAESVVVLESESVLESENSSSTAAAGGGEVILKKQPETTTTATALFISECKKHGYFISEKTGEEILDTGLDPAWLSGEFTFPEYIAQYVAEKYADKPHGQLTSIFVKALGYADRREEYQAIKDGKIKMPKPANRHRISADNVADEDIDKYFREI
jgi:hypothetical protein